MNNNKDEGFQYTFLFLCNSPINPLEVFSYISSIHLFCNSLFSIIHFFLPRNLFPSSESSSSFLVFSIQQGEHKKTDEPFRRNKPEMLYGKFVKPLALYVTMVAWASQCGVTINCLFVVNVHNPRARLYSAPECH